MDQLQEVFCKHRAHLNREGKLMSVVLKQALNQYLADLKEALEILDSDILNKFPGFNRDQWINDIAEQISGIINFFKLYENGRIREADEIAFVLFNTLKPNLPIYDTKWPFQLKSQICRIRSLEKDETVNERKDLFHIPNSKNHLVGPCRYSMPGHPCLYLCSQAQLAWFECGKPDYFAISAYEIPNDELTSLNLIDFSAKLMPAMYGLPSISETDSINIYSYYKSLCYSYPLRLACSVKVTFPGAPFKEEYVLPQALTQWIQQDDKISGIIYESSKDDLIGKQDGANESSHSVRCLGGSNIVLVTKDFDEEGYDRKLRKIVKVSSPKTIDTTSIERFYGDPFQLDLYNLPTDLSYI